MEKSLKEIWKEEMKRMPVIETAEGEIYLQPSDDGKFIEYGSITNSGILVDGEFEYDFDFSFDENLQAVAEEIFDKFGYPDFDESKKRRNENDEEIDDAFFIPVKITFEGTVQVKAKDGYEAEDIVLNNFHGTFGNAYDNGHTGIVGWDIDIHGETEIDT